MSQNNQNDASAGIGLVFAGIGILALVAFAAFAFIAFALTALAIFAWNKPRRLGRKIVIQPEEARAFVFRGLVGMGLVPAFVFFVNVFQNVHIEWQYLSHMMVFGYVAGSLGIEVLMADQSDAAESDETRQVQQVTPLQPEQRVLRPIEPEPFRYASWEDEEENGR